MARRLFGTDGIRGVANTYPMTPEIALRTGKAIAYTIRNELNPKIVIGKDTRLSGYMLESALTAGIVSMGVNVDLVGPMPTPAVALLTRSLNAHYGIVISASHNPAEDNGIKVFDKDGFKLPDEKEEEVESHILADDLHERHAGEITGSKIGKAFRIDESRGRYIEFAKSAVRDFRLTGLKMVLDCANGAAYYVAPRVFSELGADVIVLNDQPDGLNINDNCGALHPEVAAEVVRRQGADIGITLDGDADRLIVCDEEGQIIDGDQIMTLFALEMMKTNELKGNTLVVTDYSNLGVDEAIAKAGGNVVRTENGDRYVVEEMRKHGYNLGGEASGHMIFMDYTTTGDGIISSLRLLRLLKIKGMKASEINDVMQKYPQITVNVDVKEKRPFHDMPSVATKIAAAQSQLQGRGRTLVRYSGTQSVCRIMVEGKDAREVREFAEAIAEAIRAEVGAQ